MPKRLMITTTAASLALVMILVLALGAFPALGQFAGEDPTAWQGTVDASVADLFTQTAAAPRNAAMTQAVGTAFVAAQTATAAALVQVVPSETSVPPSATPEPAQPTARPEMFPTDTIADVQVAYQEFERGYMYWLRVNRQIWVAAADAANPTTGTWFCYEDTFQEGEPETDPALVPPDGQYQPRRGFGKLGRTTPGVRDSLGWATIPEAEMVSQYRYIPGGTLDANGVFTPGPGEHRLLTMRSGVLACTEEAIVGDCIGGRWRLIPLGQAD